MKSISTTHRSHSYFLPSHTHPPNKSTDFDVDFFFYIVRVQKKKKESNRINKY